MQQLILLVDALGWLTVQRTGFLAERLPHRRPLTTVFGYSSTAIPSLLTGAGPDRHGHWFLYRRARGARPFAEAKWMARLPRKFRNSWRIRTKLTEYWRRKANIQGYFSLYNINWNLLAELEPVELHDTWGVGSFPETPSLIDFLHERGKSFHVSDWRRPDAENLERARRVIEETAPETVVLYLTGIDSLQHRVGTLHTELDEALDELQSRLQELMTAMQRHGEVAVTLFSDHGMTDITGHRDLFAVLDQEGLVRGKDYHGFLDSTVARFWDVKNPERLRKALSGLPWGRVLPEQTLREWGVHYPDGDYGDLFFLTEPGLLLLPSDMGAEPLAAMHGYDPADPTSDACFLADREVPLEHAGITAVLGGLTRRIQEGW